MPLTYNAGVLTWTRDTGLSNNTTYSSHNTINGDTMNAPCVFNVGSTNHGNSDFNTPPNPPSPPYTINELVVNINFANGGSFSSIVGFLDYGSGFSNSPYRSDYSAGASVCPEEQSLVESITFSSEPCPWGGVANVGVRPTAATVTLRTDAIKTLMTEKGSTSCRFYTYVNANKYYGYTINPGAWSYMGEAHTSGYLFLSVNQFDDGDGWDSSDVPVASVDRNCVDIEVDWRDEPSLWPFSPKGLI